MADVLARETSRVQVSNHSGRWKREVEEEAKARSGEVPPPLASRPRLVGEHTVRCLDWQKELPGSVDELYKSACGAARDPEQRKRARVVRWGPRAAINRGVGSWACVAGTRRVINRAGVGLFAPVVPPRQRVGVCPKNWASAANLRLDRWERDRKRASVATASKSKSKKFGPWPQARQREPEKLEIAGSCTKREPKKEPGGCGQCCDFLSWTCPTVECGGQDGGGTHSSVQVISFPADRSRPLL